MSDKANYASVVRSATVQLSVANTARDGTGTLVPIFAAAPTGSRVDRIQIQATGTTTAGMIRLFKTKGKVGATITSMTASTTTVTVTTGVPHGRANSEKVYVTDAFPDEYNVMGAAITVVSPTVFTYTVAVAPTAATASSFGSYLTTPASGSTFLWREIQVSAITPSGTVSPWSAYAASQADFGYLPLNLAAGWVLQASTNNAETFNVDCPQGSY